MSPAAQIDEISDVLSRRRLRNYVDPVEADQMLSAIQLRAIVIHDMPIPRRSPDSKDDAILATAVAGNPELIVSGDKRDILALREAKGIPIRTAREALQIAVRASTVPTR